MSVVIVDAGSGNLRSVAKAVALAADAVGIGAGAVTTVTEAEAVRRADRIIVPGQGAFADVRRGLLALPGMTEALDEAVRRRGVPFLGICVGMQLLADRGLEHGAHPGFGWIAGEVVPLAPADPGLKIPHMGWNDLVLTDAGRRHPVLAALADGDHAYFVHSFAFAARDQGDLLATAEYGGPVAAVIGRDSVVGTQFHPEKSQETGRTLLTAFLRWRP